MNRITNLRGTGSGVKMRKIVEVSENNDELLIDIKSTIERYSNQGFKSEIIYVPVAIARDENGIAQIHSIDLNNIK